MKGTEFNFDSESPLLWENLHWHPSPYQLKQILGLQKQLRAWNSQVNLTRLTEGADFWIGQVFDSIWPLKKELRKPQRELKCIDIGSGCGIPGFLVAIALPEAQVTLLDSIQRKTNALKEISKAIGLNSRVEVITQRVEIAGHNKNYRGKFDLAMSRAVAPPPVVAEYLIPFLKENGEALLYLGTWRKSQQEELSNALIYLKAKISNKERLLLPAKKGMRNQIRLQSTHTCPTIYPRRVGLPKRKPLGS